MKYLEENFISTIIVTSNDSSIIRQKIDKIWNVLNDNFKYFEIIIVDNMSTDDTLKILRNSDKKITIIELARKHSGQQALAAGIDMAVGDYLIEVEDIQLEIDFDILLEMYKQCQRGNDFVFYTTQRTRGSSKVFYKLLNHEFKSSFTSDISSSVITLSSRRGQNKIADIGNKIVNRNVSYVLSGLKCTSLKGDISYKNRRGLRQNIGLMIDTLIYHTDLITRFAEAISLLSLLLSLLTGLYSVIAYFTSKTAPGWASLTVLGSLACAGIFLMFAILSRYLHHMLHIDSDAKNYIYRSIDKK